MKRLFELCCLVCMAAIFQGCPSSVKNDPQDHNDPRFGFAYVLTSEDTIEVYYSDVKEGRHTRDLFPLNYLYQIMWYPEQDKIEHSEEKHELHVRKLTNKSEAVVIEAYFIYINDVLYSLNDYTDPADTIQSWVDAFGKESTIILKKQPQPPYKLEDVISELEKNYPDVVHRINDTEWHNYKNYQYAAPSTYGLEELKIYLPKQETDTI